MTSKVIKGHIDMAFLCLIIYIFLDNEDIMFNKILYDPKGQEKSHKAILAKVYLTHHKIF